MRMADAVGDFFWERKVSLCTGGSEREDRELILEGCLAPC